jgi:hypothetical protein
VWDGVEALPADIFTDYVDASGNPITWATRAAAQQGRYKAIDDCFDACRKALAKFD